MQYSRSIVQRQWLVRWAGGGAVSPLLYLKLPAVFRALVECQFSLSEETDSFIEQSHGEVTYIHLFLTVCIFAAFRYCDTEYST